MERKPNCALVKTLDFVSPQPLPDECAHFRGFSHGYKQPVNPDILSRIGVLVGVQNQGETVPSSLFTADKDKPYPETLLCRLLSDTAVEFVKQDVRVLRESDGAFV